MTDIHTPHLADTTYAEVGRNAEMLLERHGCSVELRSKARRVQSFEVTLGCDVIGCAGRMKWTGEATSNTFVHVCSLCSIREEIDGQTFPRIEHHD